MRHSPQALRRPFPPLAAGLPDRSRVHRAWAVSASLLYFWLLYDVYVYDLRIWDYLGFGLGEYSSFDVGTCLVFALLPTLVMPTEIRRFSAFMMWCIYYFLYVPAVLYPVLQGLRPDTLLLASCLCAGFLLMVGLPAWRRPPTRIQLSSQTFFILLWGGYGLLSAYSLSVFWGSISFSDIFDVYGQRSLAGELTGGNLGGYATGILSGCFNPLFISLGLIHRRRLWLAAGIAGQVFIYAIFAMKSVLFSVLIISALYYLALRWERPTFRGIALFCLATVLVPLALTRLAPDSWAGLADNLSAIVFMRTYGMAGALTGTYYEFFSQNPQTHYAHINAIGAFLHYPYDVSLGEVIGHSMGYEVNANANFFATDGIAAAGLGGILFISAVIGMALRWFDSLIPDSNVRLTCAAALPSVVNLANSSFFTTLLTGGMFLLILLCAFCPSEPNAKAKRGDRPTRPRGRTHRGLAPASTRRAVDELNSDMARAPLEPL